MATAGVGRRVLTPSENGCACCAAGPSAVPTSPGVANGLKKALGSRGLSFAWQRVSPGARVTFANLFSSETLLAFSFLGLRIMHLALAPGPLHLCLFPDRPRLCLCKSVSAQGCSYSDLGCQLLNVRVHPGTRISYSREQGSSSRVVGHRCAKYLSSHLITAATLSAARCPRRPGFTLLPAAGRIHPTGSRPGFHAAPSTLTEHRESANLQFANFCVHERHLAGLLGIEISEPTPRDPDLVNGEQGLGYAF